MASSSSTVLPPIFSAYKDVNRANCFACQSPNTQIPPISDFNMEPRTRKLLFIPEHDPSFPDSQSGISSSTASALPKRPRPSFNFSRLNNSESSEDYSYNSNGGFSSYRLNPPFDSSMALTVLLLLTALFFMGFFSIYIRRFTDDSAVDAYRFRRRRPASLSSYSAAARSAEKGVDPNTVESLPVYGYDGGGAKQGIVAELECAICLSEFVEGECVKAIPFCGHVFHVGCIDTWLASHVTCPLCRTAKLFPEKAEEVSVAIGCDARGDQPVVGLVSTVDEGDTWNSVSGCVGPNELMRSSSCTGLGERVVLRRSSSF